MLHPPQEMFKEHLEEGKGGRMEVQRCKKQTNKKLEKEKVKMICEGMRSAKRGGEGKRGGGREVAWHRLPDSHLSDLSHRRIFSPKLPPPGWLGQEIRAVDISQRDLPPH